MNLRTGHSDAAVLMHRLDHVVDKRLKFRADDVLGGYRLCLHTDYGMAELGDFQNHESVLIRALNFQALAARRVATASLIAGTMSLSGVPVGKTPATPMFFNAATSPS